MSYFNNTLHIPKFVGDVWYVNKGSGSDSNDGLSPITAFETIGQAISSSAASDMIRIAAGTYTETGLDVNKNSLELWFEIGAVIQPATGTGLVVSAHYCRVICEHGALLIDPAGANTTGVQVTGNFCYLNDIRVRGDSTIDLGFDLQGNGADLRLCRCSAPLVAAFKISGDKVKLEDSCTGGESGDSSIGFWVTGSCDKTRLKNCGSQGHETAGFQVDSGCTSGVIECCYSGGGDGKWTDADDAFVWSNFSYEKMKFSTSTFTATGGVGGTGTQYNIFKVTGSIKLFNIYGHVTTNIPNTASNINLELYSSNGSVDITSTSIPTPNIQNLQVGATLERASLSDDPLLIGDNDGTPAIVEETNFRDAAVPVVLVKDDSADTYVQVNLSSALASGEIRWHIEWEPITNDGFIEPA